MDIWELLKNVESKLPGDINIPDEDDEYYDYPGEPEGGELTSIPPGEKVSVDVTITVKEN